MCKICNFVMYDLWFLFYFISYLQTFELAICNFVHVFYLLINLETL
jgi:hypothetical protein